LLLSLSRDPFTRQHEPQPPVERPAVARAAALPGTLSVLRSSLRGWLSDQTHRRKILVIMAALLYPAGFTLVALISSFNLFLIAMAICGSGFGMDSA
jgi:MFS family permease